VVARGKYLLIDFDNGTTLETHMKMSGSWHLYRKGERWRKSRGAARVVIDTDQGWQAVCFSAPHVRLIRRGAGQGATAHLGPDLCRDEVDLDDVVARFDLVEPETPVADALLDQRICCGVGNVYKCEVLFVDKIEPRRPTGSVSLDERRRMVATAHRLLRRNLGGGTRVTTTTTSGPPLAVYGRGGEPCLVCGTAIAYAKVGIHARGTYWCPSCQPRPSG
jgi:endonuclease-8